MKYFVTLALLFLSNVVFADWPQGAGSSGGFRTSESAPAEWSVVRDENIAWKLTLPETGKALWQRAIPWKHYLRISGAFSDSSAPPAVCDGKRVAFVNASGGIVCFDLNGKALWDRDLFSVGRFLWRDS